MGQSCTVKGTFFGDTTHRRQRNSTKLGSRCVWITLSDVQHWLICHKSPCNWSTTQYWWIFILEISRRPRRKEINVLFLICVRSAKIMTQVVFHVCRPSFRKTTLGPKQHIDHWFFSFVISTPIWFRLASMTTRCSKTKSSWCRWWDANSDAGDKSLRKTQKSVKHTWLRLCHKWLCLPTNSSHNFFFRKIFPRDQA